MARETVTSKDGTTIAYWRSGDGPPLVLVHGTTADHSRWTPVMPAFERRFTVCAIDRRGRGGSGDPDDYAIGRSGSGGLPRGAGVLAGPLLRSAMRARGRAAYTQRPQVSALRAADGREWRGDHLARDHPPAGGAARGG